MERAAEEEALRAKVKLLRQAMQSSEAIHKEAAVIGTRLNSHKAAIDEAMRPAKKRTYIACRVHDNIRRSLTAAGTIVRQLDLVREAEHVILLDRPNEDLNTYLEAVDKLTSVKRFFISKRRFRAGNDVHERVNELLSKAVHGLENEFHRLLTKCSKPVELEHIFNCLPSLDLQLSSENRIGPSADDYSEAPLKQYAVCTLPTLIDPCYLTLLSKLAQKSVQLDCHQKFMEIYSYQSSLKRIYGEPCVEDGKDTDVISRIVGVIHALGANLDMKAKQYKDLALGHLFLMNNIHYIVKSIDRSEVKDLFGADWIERQRRIVQQQATQYRRVAWLKVLECLSTQGLTSSVGSSTDVTQGSFRNIKNSTTSRSVIKERFKCFNMRFEEVCQKQINWDVPDRDLRESLILMIAEILLPAYRSFLKRFGPLVENSHNALKYMKYTPESLEQALVAMAARSATAGELGGGFICSGLESRELRGIQGSCKEFAHKERKTGCREIKKYKI
ncbi:hypothetical protein E2562_025411 [Oryza meyeriana var. granulata]|uniref:Exocyst subunit Exo70 family protein n=1 Tax=Oryza meyeriana var. granulata TaxID=110450 RepID=A0A6G1D9K3_9ORYZ|nr:hypothetical protein E2562_025411 [Oryza meyeriana var. granulata]